MAIDNPKESPKKKRVILPDPIKFLEDLVQPLDQDAMDSPVMQPVMGYLGPPGHVPSITRGLGSTGDAIARISKFLKNMQDINPTLLRGVSDIKISNDPFSRNADAFFDTLTGQVNTLPNPSQSLEKTLTHEFLHGIDRAAMETINPKLGKLFDMAIREGRTEPPPVFTHAMNEYVRRGPFSGSGIVTPTRQEGQQLLDLLSSESSKLSRLPGQSKIRYGNIPVSQAPFLEQFATIGTTEPPPTWKSLIQALIGIVEGKY